MVTGNFTDVCLKLNTCMFMWFKEVKLEHQDPSNEKDEVKCLFGGSESTLLTETMLLLCIVTPQPKTIFKCILAFTEYPFFYSQCRLTQRSLCFSLGSLDLKCLSVQVIFQAKIQKIP